MRWAALLKGVNLNGRKLPMADLKALVESAGLSMGGGNAARLGQCRVRVRRDRTAPRSRRDSRLRWTAYGLKTDVIVRSAADLQAVIAANPFPEATLTRPESCRGAVFTANSVPADLLDALPDHYHGRETVIAQGRELYVDYIDGIGASKLPQAMAKLKFPKLATARNWNTGGQAGGVARPLTSVTPALCRGPPVRRATALERLTLAPSRVVDPGTRPG